MPIFIALYILLSLVVAVVGRTRMMGFFGSLLFSLVLTPLLMVVILLLTAPRDPGVKRV